MFSLDLPGVNAWATQNARRRERVSYTLMISRSFDFDSSSIFPMCVSVSF